jgi:hypothetical protein
MRRRPRLKNEVRLRAMFFGRLEVLFFGGYCGVYGGPQPRRNGPVKRQRHHEHQLVHAIHVLEVAVLEPRGS